jgi:L-lactate dehydrogenase complex protein LldG
LEDVSSRDNILARIRVAQGRSGTQPDESELAKVRADIARRAIGPQPGIARVADPVRQFRRECDRLETTYGETESMAGVPNEIANYLDANDLERRVVAWHELAGLDWAGAGIVVDDRAPQGTDRTGVTGCFCAIAETGTVLLLSGPATPKATALVPDTHICIVRRSRIVATMEDSFALLRRETGELPRSTWFVSGPSRTADIEQTLVIGAHGPYRVHAILVP